MISDRYEGTAGGVIIKKVKIFIVVLVAAVCLGGCRGLGATPDTDLIKYTADAFEADLRGQVGELEFEAHLTASAPSMIGERSVSLEFFAPETLRGATVSRIDGVVSYVCGGQHFEFDGGGEGWLEIADILCAEGSLTALRRVEGSPHVVATLTQGERVCAVTVDSQSGYPVAAEQISPRHISLQVVSFAANKKE